MKKRKSHSFKVVRRLEQWMEARESVKVPPLFLLRLTMPRQPLPLPNRVKWGVLSGAGGGN